MKPFKVDVHIAADSPLQIPALASAAEQYGFDGLWIGETRQDPFIHLALAAAHTSQIQLGTAIALAFTRSPMTLACTSWDLQKLAMGRFILGLGSQVKGHVERRFSVKWGSPVARMGEVIRSLRAIWRCWQTGEPLSFNGRFYSFSLMTSFFNPGPIPHSEIPVFLAAVNKKMCRLAGELCQGLHVHPLHTIQYLKEVVVPAVEDGARSAGRKRSDVQIAVPVFAAVGDSDEEIRRAKEEIRHHVAFYASTRTYSAVLELHGWGEVCRRLHEKSVRGDWAGMTAEVSNTMLDEFMIEGRWGELPNLLKARYNGVVDRVRLYQPLDSRPAWREFARVFHS